MLNEKLDKEFREMVETELKEAQEKLEVLKKEMKYFFFPRTPMMRETLLLNQRRCRGDEAALFAGDLFRMYTRYAERNGWKTEYLIPILRR